jgi:hypothetical protein
MDKSIDRATRCYGVDPGKLGAIVGLDLDSGNACGIDMPVDEAELAALWQSIAHDYPTVEIVVEKVWSNPKWGRRHCFEFGRQKGRIEMAITSAGLPFRRITPVGWQGFFDMHKTPYERSGGKGQREWKKRLQQLAKLKFNGRVSLSQADAWLMAEYCRLHTLEGWK